MPWHGRGRPEAVDRRECLEQPARVPVDHHGHPVLDEDVTRKQDSLAGKPDHEITRRVGGAGMGDDNGVATRSEGIGPGNRDIGRVGKGEAPHRIQPYYPDPVGHQGVLPGFRGENPPVRVGDDLGPQPAKHDGAEMMVGMMVSENQPFDRLGGDRTDRGNQLLTLAWTRQGIDHHHSCCRHDEARVGSPFRAPASVPQDRVHIRRQPPHWKGRRLRASRAPNDGSEAQEIERGREGQVEAKVMLTDCLKVAPLLSVQTMVSGASLSARRV